MARRRATPIYLQEQDAPATPPAGSLALYAKDGGTLFVKDDAGAEREIGGGGSWPVGSIIQYAGATAPDKWMICYVQTFYPPTPPGVGTLLKADYPDLYDVIGLVYTDALTQLARPDHFMIPNLAGRFPLGPETPGDLGASGGAKAQTLSVDNMPIHSHSNGTLTAASAGSHSHTLAAANDTAFIVANNSGGSGILASNASGVVQRTRSVSSTNSTGAHTHNVTGTTSSAGSGTGFSIMPPYMTVNHIIRVLP